MNGRIATATLTRLGDARHVVGVFVATILAVCAFAAPASALTPAPGWEVTSHVYPTHLQPGHAGIVVVELFNTGAGPSSGPVTLTDTLPAGLTATETGGVGTFGYISNGEAKGEEGEEEKEQKPEGLKNNLAGIWGRAWDCSGTQVVTCTPGLYQNPELGPVLRPMPPLYEVRLGIKVSVDSNAPLGVLTNEVTASGGGAAGPAHVASPLTIGSAASSFGLAGFDGWFTNADGTTDTQAGSHPFEGTFSFDLNQVGEQASGGSLRDLSVTLPPGFVGDTNAVPQCTRQQFLAAVVGGCPASTQVGVDVARLAGGEAPFATSVAVYNLVPPPGIPAQFGFTAEGVNVLLDAEVRSGSDYGITENVSDLGFRPVGNTLTIWGVPGETVHNPQRCGIFEEQGYKCDVPAVGAGVKPFLTVPTSCEGPMSYGITVDPWQDQAAKSTASAVMHDETGAPTGFTGCEHLGFGPTLTVSPDTTYADTPAGLSVDLRVPQEGLTNPEGISMSNIKDTTVTLPEGVVINPGQAAGLAACQTAESGVGTNGPASCPSASKVGTDEITSPLLKDKLEGSVYVLQSNPPDLKLLVAASGEGVFLKLIGDVHLNETTGRLTTTFEDTPELPFTDFKLSFSGGAQAALTTPTGCGTYTTTSDFTPWSSPIVEDVFPSSSFAIDRGTGGTACPSSPLPFTPSMIAGSTTDQAGGFTDFSLLLQRADDQQRIGTLQFKTPEGLLGMISKIPLCPEPQAAQGTCSSASQIGHTVVEAGPGPYPLVVPQPGQPPAPIYLTGGYKGAPYGLSIVVPLVVGPFTLQTQIVRARIEVDPITTQLTVTTDPLPTIIDGIPADLRTINAVIDKPGFMFNPTGCEPGSFSGTATSDQGATAPISSHFQMGSCRSLTFKPDFRVSTSGKTSRKNGASLDAKILYPTGALGNNQASSQANVKMVKVDLPKQLPSRLTTLQKACPSGTFESNPAACPEDSKVGTATAITPVLPVTLTGPAYFVSYGGAKFPELVIVLQGYGVTVYLHGETFINKAGITSSTFRQVPDVPITSFELKLPEGPYSALAANGNLCTTKLKMPTAFTGQNGAVIKQNTPISVTGCTKHKSTKAKKKSKKSNAHNPDKKK
jgi:hypothetical protein